MRNPHARWNVRGIGALLTDGLLRASDGVFVTDDMGRIVLWNSAAEKILGYSASEVEGRACCATLESHAPRRPLECSHSVARTRVVPTFEMSTVTKAGVTACINVSVVVLGDSRRHTRYVLHLFRDVTPRHENGWRYDGGLTRREREVLELMSAGLNTAAMARRLCVSRATIRNHVQNILQKLGVHSRLEAVSMAFARRSAVEPPPQPIRSLRLSTATVKN